MSERLTDDALAAKLVGGLRPTRVELREYDPAWPARYEACAAQLRTILGDRARLIEHIGSTSVPGLVAKPVIDISPESTPRMTSPPTCQSWRPRATSCACGSRSTGAFASNGRTGR